MPGVENVAVVAGVVALAKVTVPGPLIVVQELVSVAPVSVTVPLRVAGKG